jgi:alpha-ketoglutarate-dependent 2,4-dichlorophenoxyacetate dioxygenase
MTMQAIPLHPDFGAEIRGVDLLDVVSRDDAYRAVREAFERFSLLVWRDQQVTDDLQAAVSRAFGPLEVTKVGSLGEGTVYGRITNIGPDGEPVPPDHRQALVGKANALWHTDSSFKQIPAFASMLSARIIPSEGGATEFVSTRAAWARLDPSEQAALQDRVVEHSYLYSRYRIDPDLMTPAERAALPPVRRRLTWRNPVNGLRALYIASHAGAIEGMGEAEGKALLQRLADEATEPRNVYAHRWQPGDVAMWDNRATMHRGRPFPVGERRSMVRTTISATVAEGLDEVRVG